MLNKVRLLNGFPHPKVYKPHKIGRLNVTHKFSPPSSSTAISNISTPTTRTPESYLWFLQRVRPNPSLVKMIESHSSDIAAKKIEPRSLDKAAHAAQNNDSRSSDKAPHRPKGFFFFFKKILIFYF